MMNIYCIGNSSSSIGTDGPDNTISIINNSSYPANIGVDGTLAANVEGNVNQVFKITETYYVVAYYGLKKENGISQVAIIGEPKPLVFENGKTKANVYLKQNRDKMYLEIGNRGYRQTIANIINKNHAFVR